MAGSGSGDGTAKQKKEEDEEGGGIMMKFRGKEITEGLLVTCCCKNIKDLITHIEE